MSQRPVRLGLRSLAATVAVGALLSACGVAPATDAGPRHVAAPQQRSVAVADTISDVAGVSRRLAIAGSAPSSVKVNERIRVTGSVKLRSGTYRKARVVKLQERVSGQWRTVASGKSSTRGTYTLWAPAGSKAATRVFRVYAPRTTGLSATATRWIWVKVVVTARPTPPPVVASPTPDEPPTTATPEPDQPTNDAWDPAEMPNPRDPAPVGQSTDWKYLFSSGGSRWDPCTTITWAYSPAGGYTSSLNDVKRAFAILSGRSGLHFKYVGTTTYVHSVSDSADAPDNAQLTVGWSDAAHLSTLSGTVVGVGGGSGSGVDAEDVAYRMVSGYVVLDKDGQLRPGYDSTGNPTWGQVMLHEIMHALGLGHAQGAEEVMAPSVSSVNHLLGAGDITGLDQVGAKNGCLS